MKFEELSEENQEWLMELSRHEYKSGQEKARNEFLDDVNRGSPFHVLYSAARTLRTVDPDFNFTDEQLRSLVKP